MHSVKRGGIPNSLLLNSEEWTKELLEQVKLYPSFSKIPDKYVNKYKQEDVKTALKDMYEGLCCYCESPIGIQTYERIEHLKPKSLFNSECFNWENLHFACEVCNTSYKKDNWDPINPILDPTKDNISLHLAIDLNTGEIVSINNSARALTTIEHTGLNREDLVERRNSIILKMKKLLAQSVKNDGLEEFKSVVKALSEDMGYKLLLDTFVSKI